MSFSGLGIYRQSPAPTHSNACTTHRIVYFLCDFKIQKNLLIPSSFALFSQNALSRKCQTEQISGRICLRMQQACKAPLGSGRSPFPCFVVPPTWKGKQSPQLALAPIAISIRKGGASCNPIQALLSRTRHKNRLRSGTNEEKSEHSPQPVAEHRGQTQTPPTHAGR